MRTLFIGGVKDRKVESIPESALNDHRWTAVDLGPIFDPHFTEDDYEILGLPTTVYDVRRATADELLRGIEAVATAS